MRNIEHSRCLISKFVDFQGSDLTYVMSLMEEAEQFGMRKLLACCEFCIARDTSGRYNKAREYFLRPTGRAAPAGSTRTAMCIHRVCFLRDHPVNTWFPEDFLAENINDYRAS